MSFGEFMVTLPALPVPTLMPSTRKKEAVGSGVGLGVGSEVDFWQPTPVLAPGAQGGGALQEASGIAAGFNHSAAVVASEAQQ